MAPRQPLELGLARGVEPELAERRDRVVHVLRHQDLSAAGLRGDARCQDHRDAEKAIALLDRRAAMQADADRVPPRRRPGAASSR